MTICKGIIVLYLPTYRIEQRFLRCVIQQRHTSTAMIPHPGFAVPCGNKSLEGSNSSLTSQTRRTHSCKAEPRPSTMRDGQGLFRLAGACPPYPIYENRLSVQLCKLHGSTDFIFIIFNPYSFSLFPYRQ